MACVDGVIATSFRLKEVATDIAIRLKGCSDVTLRICEARADSIEDCAIARVVVLIIDRHSYDSALSYVSRIREHVPDGAVFVVCRNLSSEQMVSLLGAGICDLISIPASDEELLARFRRGLNVRRANVTLPRRVKSENPGGLIGSSPEFVRQISRLPLVESR